MISRVWWINSILLILFVIFNVKTCQVWIDSNDSQPTIFEKPQFKSQYSNYLEKPKKLNSGDYRILAENNLFSPIRKYAVLKPPPPKPKPQPEKREKKIKTPPPPTEPVVQLKDSDIVLNGIIFMDHQKMAMIRYPNADGKRDKKFKKYKRETPYEWLSEGDKIKDYVIDKIERTRLFLVKGNKKYKVSLFSPKKTDKKGTQVKKKEAHKPAVITLSHEIEKEKKENKHAKSGMVESEEFEIKLTPFGPIKVRKK